MAVEGAPITDLIARWRGGDEAAADALLRAVYGILQGIARREIDGRHAVSLSPGDLVHEAFLKLDRSVPDAIDRGHFYAIAARAMRQVLVKRELARRAAKRSGEMITLSTLDAADPAQPLDLLALDQALNQLATHDERKARAFELRVFAGVEFEEIARLLGVSRATLARDLRAAEAWLYRALGAGDPRP